MFRAAQGELATAQLALPLRRVQRTAEAQIAVDLAGAAYAVIQPLAQPGEVAQGELEAALQGGIGGGLPGGAERDVQLGGNLAEPAAAGLQRHLGVPGIAQGAQFGLPVQRLSPHLERAQAATGAGHFQDARGAQGECPGGLAGGKVKAGQLALPATERGRPATLGHEIQGLLTVDRRLKANLVRAIAPRRL